MKKNPIIRPPIILHIKSIIKPLDIVLFLLALTITIFSIMYLTKDKGDSPQAIIDTPNGSYIYNLDTDRELKFEGPLGFTYITIKDGEAYFTDSPCANKICIHTDPASKNGDWIACLPNRIFLRIEEKEGSEEATGFDAISE